MMSTGGGGGISTAGIFASKEGEWAAKRSTALPSGFFTAYSRVGGGVS